MIVPDTNVPSEPMRASPAPAVVGRLDARPADEVRATAATLLEVRFGLERLPEGRRCRDPGRAFAGLVDADLGGRVLPFDRPAAERAGALLAGRERAGRPMELRDAQVAGIALVRRATVASRNVRPFEGTGVTVADPFGEP